ncbi:MAG TPA: hypothetical protein VGG29_16015 [Caulobacteraceae bacterium]|jgi:hypothetical protein
MRVPLLIAAITLFGLALSATSHDLSAGPAIASTLLGPICHADAPPPIAGPHRLVMLPGMGDDHMAADTAKPEAQRWFDYGLTLARSFEHNDAVLAFQRSEAVDPACSLCVWGEAYAHGPTINFDVDPAQTAADLALARRAQALAGPRLGAVGRALEASLIDRYRAADAVAADRAYARDMDALVRAAPADPEAAVFDAEAWLIVENDGDASAAARAVAVLKPLVATHLDNSGLVHFYIHATENAGVPELAAPYAERVAELAPGASHMVHMPSHTWFRIGRYEAAAQANVAALKADRAYAERTDFPTPLGRLMYHFHDVQFGLGSAMMAGDAKLALWFVRQFNQDFPSPATYDPRAAIAADAAYAALGRFAPPQAVLEAPDAPLGNPLLAAMRHYARGEAFVRLGRAADVRRESGAIGAILEALPAASRNTTAAVVAQLAQLTLAGDADLMDRDPASAIKAFSAAADLQDARLASNIDPPRWWYPVRRSLAAALLARGDAAGAEREASRTLATWKLDPKTLMIRAAAERKLGSAAASLDEAAARRGWHGDPAALQPAELL